MSESIRQHELAGAVRHLEFDRPGVRNALGQREYVFLAERFEAAAADGCKAVVLSGRGASFCAGNELAEFETAWPQPPHGPVYRFLAALAACPCPVIAAVHGAAVGIGATMLLHCDVIVSRSDAFLAYPFVKLGISVEGGSSLLLPARVGYLRAMDIVLTARKVGAPEALRLGLVSEVIDGDAVERALALAHQVAQYRSDAVAATKRQLRAPFAAQAPRVFEDEVQAINALIVRQRAERAP